MFAVASSLRIESAIEIGVHVPGCRVYNAGAHSQPRDPVFLDLGKGRLRELRLVRLEKTLLENRALHTLNPLSKNFELAVDMFVVTIGLPSNQHGHL